MIDYKYADLFQQDSVDKQLIIQFDNTTITNENLFNQSLTLEESLCSESELRFGSCEASVLKFKVANIVAPMINKWITVKMVLEGNTDAPFMIGRYKVAEDKLTADRQWREITAYDSMFDIINTDVATWYNSILPNKDSEVSLKQFRESFVRHFGLTEVVSEDGLVNDNMKIKKTIDIVASDFSESETEQISVIGEALSGQDLITAICEINGCFGHIGRDGKFHYIYLPQAIQGLYPANNLYPDHAPDYLPWQQRAGHLYPQDPKSTRVGADGTYISCYYEDYLCKTIDKLQVRQEENDIGVIVGRNGENCYIIEDNFLVYGKNSEELRKIANNIFSKITDIVYCPFDADCKGNPCLEVGDPIRISTKYEIIESYILQRTLKGIQALMDDYMADGVETYSEQVNGVQKSIKQLKGKSNVFERTIEETKSELKDVGEDVQSLYKQTANSIEMSVKNGEKTAGIYISIKNKDGEEISGANGDIVMTGIVTFKNLTGEEGNTKINGGLIETKTLSCDTLNGGEIIGQIFKGGGLTIIDEGGGNYKEYYNFEVNNSQTTVRNKFHIKDTDGNTYLSFDSTGNEAKLQIANTSLKLGSDIVLDPKQNLAVFSTPQKILIKGKGNSPGDWDSIKKTEYQLSGEKGKKEAWDIGDAVQAISRHETNILINQYDKSLNDKIDARLKELGLIK